MDKFHYDIIEGKRLLIVIIILFSSFSFTLGFFVGRTVGYGQTAKNSSTKTLHDVVAVKGEESAEAVRPKRDSVPPLPAHSGQRKTSQDTPSNHSPDQARPAAADVRQAAVRAPAEVAQEVVEEEMPRAKEIGQKSPPPEPLQQKPAPAAKTPPPRKAAVAAQKSVAPIPAAAPLPPAQAAQPAQGEETKKQHSKPPAPLHEPVKTLSAATVKEKSPAFDKDQAQGEGKEKFFIQAGAFKSVEQAHTLREQLQAQGFECQILKQSIKDQPVLFKVRIGDYDSRHDAVLVLSRLNKKGFKAFIRGYTR